jgi:hypothetical protein
VGTAGEFGKSHLVDLFSTAQVTRILLPPGGAIQSAAGALGNYNVVPLPAAMHLFALGLVGLTGRRPAAGKMPVL